MSVCRPSYAPGTRALCNPASKLTWELGSAPPPPSGRPLCPARGGRALSVHHALDHVFLQAVVHAGNKGSLQPSVQIDLGSALPRIRSVRKITRLDTHITLPSAGPSSAALRPRMAENIKKMWSMIQAAVTGIPLHPPRFISRSLRTLSLVAGVSARGHQSFSRTLWFLFNSARLCRRGWWRRMERTSMGLESACHSPDNMLFVWTA